MWGCYGGHVMKVPSIQCWDTESSPLSTSSLSLSLSGAALAYYRSRDIVPAMDEVGPSVGGGGGSVAPVNGGPLQQQQQQQQGVKGDPTDPLNTASGTQKQPQYSIPGVLHFIQHEWARFEMERNQWEVDRAELQARIAFLQGERKGQENLKHDLVRRIKMLEFSLKQERAKFHKLKYGTDPPQVDLIKPVMKDDGVPDPSDDVISANAPSWKQGRQLLRQYLNEIGYADTIIDLRSQRVRTLLGLRETADASDAMGGSGSGINGNDSVPGAATNKRPIGSDSTSSSSSSCSPLSRQVKKPGSGGPLADLIADTESSIMSTYSFLGGSASVAQCVDADDDDDVNVDACDDQIEVLSKRKKISGMKELNDCLVNDLSSDVDAEAEMILSELNMLGEGGVGSLMTSRGGAVSEDGGAGSGSGPGGEWGYRIELAPPPPPPLGASARASAADDAIDGALGLGELAQLTVNNDADAPYDISTTKEALRRTWNAKFTLRNHFDSVRALAFHPREPVLITGSEDKTLKLWNLQKTVPAKKSTSLDVEPLYTFRGHRGSVLCVAMSPTGSHCFSGDLLGNIHCWGLPHHNVDPYDSYDPKMMQLRVEGGHTDAVWGIAVHPVQPNFLTCSADGTVKLWTANLDNKEVTPRITFKSDPADGVPTSVDFLGEGGSAGGASRAVVSYTSSQCVLFDCETGKAVVRLEGGGSGGSGGVVHRAVSHPDGSLTYAAGDDRNIRFYDNASGKLIFTMVAHLDAVSCLAVDPHGLFLISGSHDCSIRLWTLDSKTCIQEITAHRKKFDESILAVAFHPSRAYIASGGADGLAKVFV